MARVVGSSYVSAQWPPERVERLMELWKEGLTTVVIGEALGTTKNAVVGCVHRLCAKGLLEPRASPIKHGGPYGGAQERRRARRIAGRALRVGESLRPLPTDAANLAPLPSVADRPQNVSRETPRPFARVVTCVFPIGEPGKPGFRWCADDAKRDSSYCAHHHSICYVRTHDLRADTDAA